MRRKKHPFRTFISDLRFGSKLEETDMKKGEKIAFDSDFVFTKDVLPRFRAYSPCPFAMAFLTEP